MPKQFFVLITMLCIVLLMITCQQPVDNTSTALISKFARRMLCRQQQVPEVELIPLSENVFSASSIPSPIHFFFDEKGKPKGFVDEDLTPITFLKK